MASRRRRWRARTRRRCRSSSPVVHQVGQRELGQRRAAEVGRAFAATSSARSRRRRDQPAQPHGGGERLGHAAGVHHPVGRHGLQRGAGRPVVAVLGVVVVLDDQLDRPCARPAARAAGPGPSTTPVGKWWAGVTSTTDSPVRASAATSRPSLVDRHRDGLQPPVRQLVVRPARARVLHRHRVGRPGCAAPARPARCACATPATTTMSSASARTPRTRRSQRGQRRAQHRVALRVAVAQVGRARPASAARSARSQAARGNADRSGTPGRQVEERDVAVAGGQRRTGPAGRGRGSRGRTGAKPMRVPARPPRW